MMLLSFQWNGFVDDINDCNGFLVLWRYFWDLVCLFSFIFCWQRVVVVVVIAVVAVYCCSSFICHFFCIQPWYYFILFANRTAAVTSSLMLFSVLPAIVSIDLI